MYRFEEKKICEVGDSFYRVIKGEIVKVKIKEIKQINGEHYIYRDTTSKKFFNRNFGDFIFKTKEEAQNYMDRKENLIKKKELLQKYEEQLNVQFNLKNHRFVK
jgi:hypothetical protein